MPAIPTVLFRRYADDNVACYKRYACYADAKDYLREQPGRMETFERQLPNEKSALEKFNRWEQDQSGK